MSVPVSYLTSTKNTKDIFEALRKAGVPTRFNYDFLKQIGYASSSDRPMIPVLKALGFIDDGNVPTDRYRRYKERSAAVMAEALRDAYASVFTIDPEAHKRTQTDLKGIFGRLSDKGESVTSKMAATFKTLSDLADFSVEAVADNGGEGAAIDADASESGSDGISGSGSAHARVALHHDVHIHLPISTDVAVYDAIFKSLRDNLL